VGKTGPVVEKSCAGFEQMEFLVPTLATQGWAPRVQSRAYW